MRILIPGFSAQPRNHGPFGCGEMGVIVEEEALQPGGGSPARLNRVRHHGVLGPNAGFRRLVVPGRSVSPGASSVVGSAVSRFRRRLGWAVLLARVLAVDVTRCPTCGGRLLLVAVLRAPSSIRHYLSGVGLAAEPAAIAAVRPPPQRDLALVV